MISVLIATRNRPEKISRCIRSILRGTYINFEILLIDQSTNDETEILFRNINNGKVRFIRMPVRGKSKALNLAISKARGNILAFTDDDCIVSKSWLQEIYFYYNQHRKTAGIFGNVLPYQPAKHTNEMCLATFYRTQKKTIDNPGIIHYRELGLGNNMTIRKTIFSRVGLFKEWLGVGSISMAGEESDLIFRILVKGYKLAFSPKIFLYHDHWESYFQEEIIQAHYSCGLVTFYIYSLMVYKSKLNHFLLLRIRERIWLKIRKLFYLTKKLNFYELYKRKKDVLVVVIEFIYIIRGFIIGIFFANKIKLLNLIENNARDFN